MAKKVTFIVLGGLLLLLAAGAVLFWNVLRVYVPSALGFKTTPPPTTQPAATRPSRWAVPLAAPGVGNFYRVSDTLYRGEQPTAEGMRQLKSMGIKTIVNLRSFTSDGDKIGQTDLRQERIYMKAWHAEDEDIVKFLKIATDKSKQPVFVHCWHGADRTGVVCAAYRIVVQGWSKEDAISEMTEGDYNFHNWQNLIDYLRKMDVEKIRRQAGLSR